MSDTNVKNRIALERRIVSRIVKDAIDLGYTISVFDGESYPIQGSADYRAVMRSAFSTDEDTLIFREQGRRIGSVYLVYGNDGYDVVANYTDNPEVEKILHRANALVSLYA